MTLDEFHSWFTYHVARFPGIVVWLKRLPEERKGALPARQDVMDAWFEQLAAVSQDAARLATQALAALQESQQPKAFDRHPSWIAAYGRGQQREQSRQDGRWRFSDGEQTYQCPQCQDTGLLTVYAARTILDAIDGQLSLPTAYTTTVACSCGQAKDQDLTVFDRDRMLLYDGRLSCQEELAAIEAFAARFRRQGAEIPF